MNTPEKSQAGHATLISRIKLVFVIFLFLGPLLGAFVWYYGFEARFAPSGQSNHSPLITPPVPLQQFENPGHDGNPVSNRYLETKWTIVHLVGNICDQSCQTTLYNTRQARLAVGKDSSRIQRLIIVSDPELAREIGINHTDATIAEPGGNGIEVQLRLSLTDSGAGEHDASLIDPLGNLMMSVPADLDPRLLIKDLKKLLKLSHIG